VVWKARGVDLAFAFQQEVAVEGTLPNGGHDKVTAKMPMIAAYLCIKAITLSERKKEKDAYDICFCIENYPGGYKMLAEEFRGKTDHPLIAEGIAHLREKFGRAGDVFSVTRTVEELSVVCRQEMVPSGTQAEVPRHPDLDPQPRRSGKQRLDLVLERRGPLSITLSNRSLQSCSVRESFDQEIRRHPHPV
jgi:hypothetical protein